MIMAENKGKSPLSAPDTCSVGVGQHFQFMALHFFFFFFFDRCPVKHKYSNAA